MMDFWQAIGTCFRKYADFSGRAQRSEFWWWYLFSLLANLIFGILDTALFGIESLGVFGLIFDLIILLPSIAVAARRLHDIDKSGWWQIMYLVPLVLVMLSALIGSSQDSAFFSLVAIISGLAFFIAIIVLIVWHATKGTQGDNSFGPDPLANQMADAPPQNREM